MPVNIGVNIQRSPNRINQQLREAGVEGKFPKLLLDFKDQYYLASGGSKTLANAVTHTRSGNAVMTDGYGPELVVNGGFDSDLSGWTVSAGEWEWQEGRAHLNTTNYSILSQNVSSEKAVEIFFTVADYNGSGGFLIMAREYDGTYRELTRTNSNSTGSIRVQNLSFYVADVSTIEIWRQNPSSAANGYIDNVSVREMPVLKWAPHNLLTYSEEFDNASWTKGSNVTVTANYAEAPDGTQTADRIVMPNDVQTYVQDNFNKVSGAKYVGAVFARATSGTDSFLLNVDSQSETKNVTETWQLFTKEITATSSGSALFQIDNNGTMDILFWGAHVYRSDLGGMVDNPDQPASRASYVPTTSAAKYLPRIGHHVYNGSAWVNEGLLAESEARTNLATYSDIGSWINRTGASLTSNDAIAPDGTETADKLVEDSATSFHFTDLGIVMGASAHTASVYLKAAERTTASIFLTQLGNHGAVFDLSSGTIDSVTGTGNTATIQDVGNGWYRCAVTNDGSADINDAVRIGIQNGALASYAGDGSSGIYVWGVQVEQGSTPSSLIPTSGSSVTRAAETFTIPSANLPWPEPNYIGSELVTNGTFDTSSDWTLPTGFSISSGVMSYDGTGTSFTYAVQAVSTTSGKVYAINFDTLAVGGSVAFGIYNDANLIKVIGTTGSTTVFFVASASTTNIIFKVQYAPTQTFTIDNVSVREIDPLSVSIAMDGRVSFADTGDPNEALMYRWFDDADNRIQAFLSTFGTLTGGVYSYMEYQDTADSAGTAGDYYTPDVLTPYNMAARYGSTFVNAAHEGVALTADTTPVGLPDLSSIDMTIAHGYMGTVGSVRIWDRDIGDTGIVEATNPSLEPSLSLTFEGTGTNSFVVNDWSK